MKAEQDDGEFNSLDCLVLVTIFFWLWVCGGLAFLAQRLNWIG